MAAAAGKSGDMRAVAASAVADAVAASTRAASDNTTVFAIQLLL
jgi:hypothetical protein